MSEPHDPLQPRLWTRATIDTLTRSIETVCALSARAAQDKLDVKTKPRRSLGRLETLACQIAAVARGEPPRLLRKTIVVMGADHGVASEGVSAYPQEVTAQMMPNFARGGAAINVLARAAGAHVHVVDMGVASPLPRLPEIQHARIANGTRNFAHEPAMTEAEALEALATGYRLAHQLHADGTRLLGIGGMGIGNTTSASALTAALTGVSPAEVTGLGTGIDQATHARKVEIIRSALQRHGVDPRDPLAVLRTFGGFGIAGLAGVLLGAAATRTPVIVDGFIASTAALVAVRMADAVRGYLIASHRSVEAGHRIVLEQLGQKPLLDLELRLGEGTGTALAMPLCDAALAVLHEMATFESADVSDTGR